MKKLIFFSLILFSLFSFSSNCDLSNFKKVVAIGDSLFAAFSSGGLMVDYQKNSIPALIAKQFGISDFQQPFVSYPGIPALLELKSLSPVTIEPISEEDGEPLNLYLERPYDNLAVPGANLYDCLNKKSGDMNDLILRGLGTQVEQALSLQPDVILIWIGNNDALGAALMGTVIIGLTITPKETFENLYIQLLNTVKAYVPYGIVANIPDVTAIPFVTTIPPFIVNPATGLPVYDQNGNLIPYLGQSDTGSPFVSLDSYILLTAKEYISQGYGIPQELGGKGEPLPDFTVLTPSETATIHEYIAFYNDVIKREALKQGYAFFDVNSFFHNVSEEGIEIAGMNFTSDFLQGGLFSYDGVHPTALGYTFLANEFINSFNSYYGCNLPYIGLSPFSFETTPTLPFFNIDQIVLKDWEEWLSIFFRKNFIWNKISF